jgi:hypothetical protein
VTRRGFGPASGLRGKSSSPYCLVVLSWWPGIGRGSPVCEPGPGCRLRHEPLGSALRGCGARRPSEDGTLMLNLVRSRSYPRAQCRKQEPEAQEDEKGDDPCCRSHQSRGQPHHEKTEDKAELFEYRPMEGASSSAPARRCPRSGGAGAGTTAAWLFMDVLPSPVRRSTAPPGGGLPSPPPRPRGPR